MARTIKEIRLHKNVDEAEKIIQSVLSSNGYKNKIVKGENVWAKGDGVIMAMGCFAFSFTENGVILQGWIYDAIAGESELKGFLAMAVKKKMKSIMDEIEAII